MELTVGQVAKRAGINVSALHFYEQKGLISSWRNNGNQRRYHRAVLRRLAVIKAAQQVGLTLDEILEALSHLPKHQAPSKKEWGRMAERWNQALSDRIARLQQLQNNLSSCVGCGCLSMDSCLLYNPDDVYGKIREGDNVFNQPGKQVTDILQQEGIALPKTP